MREVTSAIDAINGRALTNIQGSLRSYRFTPEVRFVSVRRWRALLFAQEQVQKCALKPDPSNWGRENLYSPVFHREFARGYATSLLDKEFMKMSSQCHPAASDIPLFAVYSERVHQKQTKK